MSAKRSSASTGTHSSVRCMVRLRSPNSATGQWSLMKRASDVPPVVLRAGVTPVTAATESAMIVLNRPGGVTKASPETSDRHVVGLAGRIEARTDDALEARAGERSLKRTLKRAAAAPGMTFVASLPTSIEVSSSRLG